MRQPVRAEIHGWKREDRTEVCGAAGADDAAGSWGKIGRLGDEWEGRNGGLYDISRMDWTHHRPILNGLKDDFQLYNIESWDWVSRACI